MSVDSLDAETHDHFRGGAHALERTKEALARLREHRLDFVVQTTATPRNAAEIPALLDWAAAEGAVCFNLYFLVPTGRGVDLMDLAPQRIETLLAELAAAESRYRGTMMVRAKCAPHFMRHVHQADPDSPVLSYRTRCPCGIDYCRITPDGKLTPCPYMPTEAGDLRRAVVRRDLVGLARVRRAARSASSAAAAAAASTAWSAAAAAPARSPRPATTWPRTRAASTSRRATCRSSPARR